MSPILKHKLWEKQLFTNCLAKINHFQSMRFHTMSPLVSPPQNDLTAA